MTTIAEILAEHGAREGPLLPILHAVQKSFGHVSEEAMREIAHGLNLTRAEVYGVVSFYHDFHLEADARPVIKLCRAEACQARGVEALVPMTEAQTRVKVDAIYCLGLCAIGPAAMVGDRVFARIDGEKLQKLLETA